MPDQRAGEEQPVTDVEVPEHVRKAFGDDAVRCEPCGGWHHRLYHVHDYRFGGHGAG